MNNEIHFSDRLPKHWKLSLSLCATRFYVGPETTTSSQAQKTTNAQSTVGDTGAGAVAVSTGAGGETQLQLNETSVDPALVESLGNSITSVANTAIAGETTTSNNAIIASANDLTDALGFGAEVSQNADDLASTAIGDVTQTAVAGQQEAQSAAFQAQLEAGQLGSDLAQIVANTVPQSSGATDELLNGDSPIDASNVVSPTAGFSWSTVETWAVIISSVAAIYVFYRSKGNNA